MEREETAIMEEEEEKKEQTVVDNEKETPMTQQQLIEAIEELEKGANVATSALSVSPAVSQTPPKVEDKSNTTTRDESPVPKKEAKKPPVDDKQEDSLPSKQQRPAPRQRFQQWRQNLALRRSSHSNTSLASEVSTTSAGPLNASTPQQQPQNETSSSSSKSPAAEPTTTVTSRPPSAASLEEEFLIMKPQLISITYFRPRDDRRRLGLLIESNKTTKKMEIHRLVETPTTILKEAPFLKGCIESGDVLVSIHTVPTKSKNENNNNNNTTASSKENGNDDDDKKEIEQPQPQLQLLEGLTTSEAVQRLGQARGIVTLTIQKKQQQQPQDKGDEEESGSTVTDKSQQQPPLSQIRQAVFLNSSKHTALPFSLDLVENDFKFAGSAAKTLKISNLNNPWFQGCCLQKGQMILTMNQCPILETTPEDALMYLATNLSLGCSDVAIKTYHHYSLDKAKRKSSRLRQATVAVGGSAIVATGAVLMVTPLHPLGHAMAWGGMTVLGAEFGGGHDHDKKEGPTRRQQAGQSLRNFKSKMSERWARRQSSSSVTGTDSMNDNGEATPTSSMDDSEVAASRDSVDDITARDAEQQPTTIADSLESSTGADIAATSSNDEGETSQDHQYDEDDEDETNLEKNGELASSTVENNEMSNATSDDKTDVSSTRKDANADSALPAGENLSPQ